MSPFQPGSFASMMPNDENSLIRRSQEQDRAIREIVPSIADSFGPVIADLQAKQAALADLIASVVGVGDFDHTVTGFDPVISTWATVSSVTLTVPAGFTQAVVTAVAYAAIRNTTPSTATQIHCRALVAGSGGPVDDEASNPGVRSTALSVFPTRVTGLTAGGTFTVAAQAYAGADFTADANNVGTISGTVLWLR